METELAAAIAAWQRYRTAGHAELVDALAARVPAPALAARDKAGFHREYVALAKRPAVAVATTLAAGLAQRVPIRETGYLVPERDRKRHRWFLDRVAALAARPPDPRIGRAAVDVVARAPFSVEDADVVYGPVIALAVACGDERSLAALDALIAKPIAKTATVRSYLATALPKAVARLRAATRPAMSATQRAELTARLAAFATPAPEVTRPAADLAALLAECLANPDDDAPRLVYADALLERADPRGELIQLQLRAEQAPPPEADVKRAAAIQRKHEKAWLGDLTRITKLRVFRRGFLDECMLLQGAAAEPAIWKAAAADPRLATVRTLHKGSASEDLYRSFVLSPAARSLRRAMVPSLAMLEALTSARRPLDGIQLSCGLHGKALAALDRAIPALGLRSLAFATSLAPRAVLDQLRAWPGHAALRELIAMPDHRASAAWEADDLAWLFAFDELGVERLGVEHGPYVNRVVLTRTEAGVEADIVANQDWLVVRLLTRRLPRPVTKLVLRATSQLWFGPGPKLAKALASLPASAVELRDRWRSVERRDRRRE